MAAKTFTNTAGGTWDTGSNWSPPGTPGSTDDALINVAGTYTVTLDNTQTPDTAQLNSTSATLLITATGQLLLDSATAPVLALDAGTLELAGILGSGDTIINNGAAISMTGGTLDGVVWNGPLGDTVGTFGSINIKDGITVNDAAGNPGGTIDIGTLYQVSVLDANTLDNLTIAFGNYNNERLNGSNGVALILGSAGTIVQSAPTSTAYISGLEFDNHGVTNLTGSSSRLFVESQTFDNIGSLIVAGSESVTIGGSFANTGTAALSASGVVNVDNSASNTGAISLNSAATLVASHDIDGTGEITLKLDSVLDVHNVTGTVVFLDGKDTLKLEAPGSYTGAIAGFQNGDKIDLPGQSVTTLDPIVTTGSTTLNVVNSGTTIASLNLLGNYTGYTFSFGPDGATGTSITTACYAADTHVLSARGDTPVEDLRVGDRLVTRGNHRLNRIVWLGHQHIDCRRHLRPTDVSPVRVRAGAFGSSLPARDLLLSPDHAVFVDGMLVPVRHLINGSTIVQEPVDEVTYYHVELAAHDVILAEGLPCESYLDTGNRAAFVHSGIRSSACETILEVSISAA